MHQLPESPYLTHRFTVDVLATVLACSVAAPSSMSLSVNSTSAAQ